MPEVFTEIDEISKEGLKSFSFIPETACFLEEKFIDLKDLSSKEVLKDKKILNLVDENRKALIIANSDFFPFLLQDLPKIIMFYSRIKNRDVKLYIHTYPKTESIYWKNLKTFLIKYLTDIDVEVEFLNEKGYDGIMINNWCPLENGFSPLAIRMLSSKTKKYVKNQKTEPFRKVFVARDKSLPQRIDSDKSIQEFFIDQGFEIVYPESFETFIDQINYFSECKVIAGISGSALSNCIFMKPGGTVIELLSVFRPNGDDYPVEIHHYYRIMANAMKHLYFSVSNLSAKADDFTGNKKYLDIIKML
jgi:hypothetical protein